MSNLFSECRQIQNINLTSFNTLKVVNMSSMFTYCMNLKELDLKSFDTRNVQDMSYMFDTCRKLQNITFGNFFNTGSKIYAKIILFLSDNYKFRFKIF